MHDMKQLFLATKLIASGAVAAGAVTAVVHFAASSERAATPAASSAAPPPSPAAAAPRGSLAELLANAMRAPLGREAPAEPFAHGPHAAAPSAPAPIAARTAPPFPFKYAGWLGEGAARKLLLERGSMVVPVKAGDVLEGFRIDALHDERMDVTFVASGQQLSLLYASLTTASATAASAGGAPAGMEASLASPLPSAGSATAATSTFSFSSAGGFLRGPGSAPSSSASPAQAISAATDTPAVGSMPTGAASAPMMQIGSVPSGIFPSGPTPRGRLGFEPGSSRQLGSDAPPNGKLGQ